MIFAQMLEIVALSDLASVLCARKFSFAPQIAPFSFIGLSALAEGPMDSRSCVRSFVRSFATRYLEIRASDFDDFCTDVRDSCPE